MNKLQQLLAQARDLEERGESTQNIQEQIMDEFVLDKSSMITYEEKHRRMHSNDSGRDR